jgi:hypothetical protein
LKDRQALGWNEESDGAGGAGGPLDEAGAFEGEDHLGEDHLVDGGRGDAEEAPHVGFGGRALTQV